MYNPGWDWVRGVPILITVSWEPKDIRQTNSPRVTIPHLSQQVQYLDKRKVAGVLPYMVMWIFTYTLVSSS